jgi:hypothetical protein
VAPYSDALDLLRHHTLTPLRKSRLVLQDDKSPAIRRLSDFRDFRTFARADEGTRTLDLLHGKQTL